MTLQTIIQQYRPGSEPGRTRDGEAYLPLLGAWLIELDFKIRFEPLTPSQGRAMFRQELQRLGGDTTRIDLWEERVARLHGLTPGDFAVVVKQFDLLGTAVTPDAFYAGLSRECAAKGAMSRNIGFAVPLQDAIVRQAA